MYWLNPNKFSFISINSTAIFFEFAANALIGPIDVKACGLLDIRCMISVQNNDKCL